MAAICKLPVLLVLIKVVALPPIIGSATLKLFAFKTTIPEFRVSRLPMLLLACKVTVLVANVLSMIKFIGPFIAGNSMLVVVWAEVLAS
jgi:hypothetical protein